MNTQLSKTKRILFLIAVMLSNVAVMADTVIYPITSNLYGAFPDSMGMVNYILSGPPLILVVVSLITPLILKKVSKKTMMIIAGILFTVGSVFGVTVESVLYMAFMRSLVGIGQGIINVCAIALICEVYYEENIRARYVGFYNASMNIIGMVFQFAAGMIAAGSHWQNAFLLYLTSIPMIVMMVLFIPNLSEQDVQEAAMEMEAEAGIGKKTGFGADFWEMIIIFFILATLCMIPAYFMSVYISEKAIGTEALAGTAGTVGQIASFLTAMVFGPIFAKCKRLTMVLGLGVGVAAFGIWAFGEGAAVAVIVYVLECIAYLLLFTYCYAQAPALAPAGKSDFAIGIVTAAYGIGSFVSTYLVTFVMGLLNTDSVLPTLPIWFIIAVVIFVFDILYVLVRRKQAA